jgi:hypothetical protein
VELAIQRRRVAKGLLGERKRRLREMTVESYCNQAISNSRVIKDNKQLDNQSLMGFNPVNTV